MPTENAENAHLVDHIRRIHSKETPYECDHCKKKFASLNEMS